MTTSLISDMSSFFRFYFQLANPSQLQSLVIVNNSLYQTSPVQIIKWFLSLDWILADTLPKWLLFFPLKNSIGFLGPEKGDQASVW